MEKREIQLDEKLGVPICYVKFFGKKGSPTPDNQDNNTKPNSEKSKPTILIKITKEKNKNYTVASFPSSLKFQSKILKQFQKNLNNKFSTGANIKEKPEIVISVSGKRAEELREEIEAFFDLPDDIEFKMPVSKIDANRDFKIFIKLGEDDDTVNVTWKQRGAPKNIEDTFQKVIYEELKAEFTNYSTHKDAIFSIKGVSSEYIKNYFLNNYTMDPNQIEVMQYQPGSEPKYHYELFFDYKNPLSEMEQTFINQKKKRYFTEMSHTISDLYQFQKDKYLKKKFYDDLEFTRVPDRNSKNKWTTKINARKIFSIDQLSAGFAIKEKDLVHVTYHNRDRIKGKIVEIDKETGIVTASFILESGQKPPGVDIDEDEYSDEELERREQEMKEQERREYEELMKRNQGETVHVETPQQQEEDEEEEEIVDDKEEARLNDIFIHNENLIANGFVDDDDRDYRNIDNNNDGRYHIYFEVVDSFYEKCAQSLLCFNDYNKSESDSFQQIKNIIVGNDNYDDQNKTDKKLSYKEVSVDLTNSEFLTDVDRKNQSLLSKLVIKPTREQKKCVEMILSNNLSIIHGPPGTGKTYSLGLFVYHLLTRSTDEKRRILLCSKSNQAVENMVKFVSPIVRALGKKMVWLAGLNKSFEDKNEFDRANEEEKNLVLYHIMKRKTIEAQKYQKLQEEKWKYNECVKKERQRSNKIPKFPSQKSSEMNDLRNTIESNLVFESDVVCCTIPTSAKWTIAHNKFHYIFIDEAQYINEVESIVPLIHQPNKLILLGDSKQLESYANRKLKKRHPNSLKSLYKKLMKKGVPSQSLNIQFRMNPLILEFSNKNFYSEKVQTASDVEKNTTVDLPFIQTPIAFVNVPNGKEKRRRGGSYINDYECLVVQKIVTDLKVCQIPGREVAVITPYFSQSLRLNQVLAPLNYKGLKIATISSFQGCERDFVIFSLVRSSPSFREMVIQPDKNSLNVALTRARKGMFIVAKFGAFADVNFNKNQYLIDLCSFYQDNRSIIDESKIELLKHLVQKPVKFKPLKITRPGDPVKNNDDVFNDSTSTQNVGNGQGLEQFDKIIGGGNIDDNDDDDDISFQYDYDDDDDDYDENVEEEDFDDDEDD